MTTATLTRYLSLTITFDAADIHGCPWLVIDADGEVLAGFETEAEASAFAAELKAEALDEAAALAWEAGRAEEMERETLLDDLAGLVDAGDMSDFEGLSLSELRAMAEAA